MNIKYKTVKVYGAELDLEMELNNPQHHGWDLINFTAHPVSVGWIYHVVFRKHTGGILLTENRKQSEFAAVD